MPKALPISTHVAQPPAAACNAFRRWHQPDPPSAETTPAGLGSTRGTRALSKTKWEKLHFPAKGDAKSDAKGNPVSKLPRVDALISGKSELINHFPSCELIKFLP